MAKSVINPGNLRKNQPAGEHITRIMYDDNEPPKNYIWGKPDGFLYVWNGEKWVLLNDKSKTQPHDFPPQPGQSGQSAQSLITNNKLVTKPELDAKIKLVKTEIISYLTQLINAKDCPDSDGENAIRWFKDEILPEINWIEDQLDSFATKTELADVRQELLDAINELTPASLYGELIERIEALEGLPHNTYVTQEELLNALSNIASSEAITLINNAITNINTEITNIKNTLSENELVISSALNDLNDRMSVLENGNSLNFVTAEDVVDIHSIVL